MADDDSPPISLLLEYIPDGYVFNPEKLTPDFTWEVLRRFDAIHQCGVCHGDPHPRNIVFSKSRGPV